MSKRRKQGEGTLRKRADGRWEARVVIGYDEKGNPITKNVTAMEKGKCLEKLEQLKEKCGVQLTGKVKAEMAFGDWLDFWYQQYAKQTLRPTTQSGYENMIYNHIIPDIGKIPLNKLTQNDLQQFYTRLKNGGRKVRKNLIFFIFSIAIQGRACYNEGKRDNRWMQDKKFEKRKEKMRCVGSF